ncbi:phosphoenolpyruvate-utilizing N-terminal domain-containing protein [Tessaracoccus flavus]|uniref:Phosphotransferase system enzyme I N-terminal domain-containing protein n=1 Tax=Tessaracoccus flavus TaxID=1610493 RepID=A0A1Q2CF25_9ACTN|nr:phosphoenolpyruvate-utilizing N-terminal domain-containing protein [Tessaracoccus flavus]AQP44719.1 hypothetical protein RPIT_07790 [Tessaracoccus flavus]SDZ21622.1 YD repeat-containing protein [Tessaracoccus flavus]
MTNTAETTGVHTIAALLTGVGVSGGYAVGVVALVPLPEPLPDEPASTDTAGDLARVGDALETVATKLDATAASLSGDAAEMVGAAGRMAWVEADGAGRLEFSRDAAGRVLAATGSAGTQQWAYTGNLVVSHTGTATGAEVGTTVERDEDGRVAAVVRDGVRTEGTHDAAGQLVAARSGDVVHTWSWDAAGRLVAETAAGRTTTHTYGPSGQLATRETDGVAAHYTYDRAGRRTSEVGPDGRIEFTWGDLGWLTSVTGPQGRLLVPAGSAG